MKTYKVLIVDDSAFMRKVIFDLISEDPQFEVIYSAKDGSEAIKKVIELKPDLITMDIEMPIMNGLDALKVIMRDYPTPVIMLSSLTHAGAAETIQALEMGAVDFIKKPSGTISLDLYKVKHLLLEKMHIAVKTNHKKFTALHTYAPTPHKNTTQEANLSQKSNLRFKDIVAIGASTGGPKALHLLITQIPKSFPAPILIVQHMPPKFTKSLAERLDSLSEVKVIEAENHCLIKPGTVYIAPGGYHMTMIKVGQSEYRIQLSEAEARNGHRPSVDVLFESLIPFHDLKRHIIIMTGMGRDGAKAMKALQEAGVESTFAESSETCIVYGMPRAAIELMVVKHVLPLYDIPSKLVEVVVQPHLK